MTGTTANIPFEAAFTAGTTPGWSVYKCVQHVALSVPVSRTDK
jgi:hypothetical protein